jgi:5-methylcytosine-specific restriction endonuclease McrA
MNSELRNEVWKKTDGKCWYCGTQTIPFGSDHNSFVVDHVLPRKRGGKDELRNLVPACFSCNAHKSSKRLFDWANENLDENGNRTGIMYSELMRYPIPETAWEDSL